MPQMQDTQMPISIKLESITLPEELFVHIEKNLIISRKLDIMGAELNYIPKITIYLCDSSRGIYDIWISKYGYFFLN